MKIPINSHIRHRSITFWPITGWLIGGIMAVVIYFGSAYVPMPIAVGMAIVLRILITRGKHEDSLRRCVDAFFYGKTPSEIIDRQRSNSLRVIGLIALLVYLILLFTSLCALSPQTAALTIFAAEPFSKMVASQLVQMLPYAWNTMENDMEVAFRKPDVKTGILLFLQGIVPLGIMLYVTKARWDLLVFVPCLVMYFLYLLMWNRLKGYNAHCLNMVARLIELTLIITAAALFYGLV